MSTVVYVFTRHKGNQGTWSRYYFPFDITEFAQLDDDLYIRHGDRVSVVDRTTLIQGTAGTDEVDGFPVNYRPAVIRWSYLDFGTPGQSKMLESVDVVTGGSVTPCEVSVGYNQNNFFQTTQPVTITSASFPADTMEQTPVPIPVTAPSFSFIVTYPDPGGFKFHSLVVNIHDTTAPA